MKPLPHPYPDFDFRKPPRLPRYGRRLPKSPFWWGWAVGTGLALWWWDDGPYVPHGGPKPKGDIYKLCGSCAASDCSATSTPPRYFQQHILSSSGCTSPSCAVNCACFGWTCTVVPVIPGVSSATFIGRFQHWNHPNPSVANRWTKDRAWQKVKVGFFPGATPEYIFDPSPPPAEWPNFYPEEQPPNAPPAVPAPTPWEVMPDTQPPPQEAPEAAPSPNEKPKPAPAPAPSGPGVFPSWPSPAFPGDAPAPGDAPGEAPGEGPPEPPLEPLPPPDVVVNPGPVVDPAPGGEPAPPPPLPPPGNAPPGENVVEGKAKGKGKAGAQVLRVLSKGVATFTEAEDAVNAIWKALPGKCKTRKKGQRTQIHTKAHDIYSCMQQPRFDMRKFLAEATENVIENQIEDAIYAIPGMGLKKAAKAQKFYSSALGYGTGAALDGQGPNSVELAPEFEAYQAQINVDLDAVEEFLDRNLGRQW